MAFLTYASCDFAADARGYTWGGVAELYWDDWAVRVGRITPPRTRTSSRSISGSGKFYGDQLEIEHTHQLFGQRGRGAPPRLPEPREHGALRRRHRGVPRRTRGKNATTCDARPSTTARGNATRARPVLGAKAQREGRHRPQRRAVRRPTTSASSSARCTPTGRPRSIRTPRRTGRSPFGARRAGARPGTGPLDVVGRRLGRRAGSRRATPRTCALGGVDGFIGDGNLNQAPESVFEVFYSVNLLSSVVALGRLPAPLEPRVQRRPRPGRHPRREGPCGVLGL